jgi:hypothetical protein
MTRVTGCRDPRKCTLNLPVRSPRTRLPKAALNRIPKSSWGRPAAGCVLKNRNATFPSEIRQCSCRRQRGDQRELPGDPIIMAAGLLLAALGGMAPSEKPKNFVIMLADDMGCASPLPRCAALQRCSSSTDCMGGRCTSCGELLRFCSDDTASDPGSPSLPQPACTDTNARCHTQGATGRAPAAQLPTSRVAVRHTLRPCRARPARSGSSAPTLATRSARPQERAF